MSTYRSRGKNRPQKKKKQKRNTLALINIEIDLLVCWHKVLVNRFESPAFKYEPKDIP